MQSNKKTFGRDGEQATARWLALRGYKIISRNFVAHGGELDIVAYKRRTIHIVEVKTRSNDRFGTPSEAVTLDKQQHIKKAARQFLYKHNKCGYLLISAFFGERKLRVSGIQYDISEVYMTETGHIRKIKYIKNAFE